MWRDRVPRPEAAGLQRRLKAAFPFVQRLHTGTRLVLPASRAHRGTRDADECRRVEGRSTKLHCRGLPIVGRRLGFAQDRRRARVYDEGRSDQLGCVSIHETSGRRSTDRNASSVIHGEGGVLVQVRTKHVQGRGNFSQPKPASCSNAAAICPSRPSGVDQAKHICSGMGAILVKCLQKGLSVSTKTGTPRRTPWNPERGSPSVNPFVPIFIPRIRILVLSGALLDHRDRPANPTLRLEVAQQDDCIRKVRHVHGDFMSPTSRAARR